MIRRRSVALAFVALGTVSVSACSTFSNNDNAASVGSKHLSVKAFEAISNDIGGTPDALGERTGDTARSVLTAWVNINILVDGLEHSGAPITTAERAAAEKSLTSQDSASWAKLAADTKALEIDYTATQDAVATNTTLVPDSTVEAAYEQGVGTTSVVCLRLMAFSTQDKADAAYAALQKGTDFATVAKSSSEDTATASTGGILADAAGNECVDSSNLQSSDDGSTILQVLAGSQVGVPSTPVQVGTEFYILLERPYSEVKDKLRSVAPMQALLVSPVAHKFSAGVKARIDSRYGMWDSASGQVVATQ
ncbi:MAG TPA: peptidylprolyl isomerase [Ilumatobacteraceae bacterium]